MAGRTDPRITRTVRALEQAIVELASQQPVSQITVADLADRARVTRATFYNRYHGLRSLEEVNPPAATPIVIANGQDGESYGAELTAEYVVTSRWRVRQSPQAPHLKMGVSR